MDDTKLIAAIWEAVPPDEYFDMSMGLTAIGGFQITAHLRVSPVQDGPADGVPQALVHNPIDVDELDDDEYVAEYAQLVARALAAKSRRIRQDL